MRPTALLFSLALLPACNSRGGIPAEPAVEDLSQGPSDLLTAPGQDLGADLLDPCRDGACPVVELDGPEVTVCRGQKFHVPTVSVSTAGGGFAVGCLPSGSQQTPPTLKFLDGMGMERQLHNLLTMDGYYYKSLQLTYLDGRFQAVYEYNCDDNGSWGVGWGWGCVDFREFDGAGMQKTASLVFGMRGHNGHPVLDFAGDGFGVAWVSYDRLHFRRILQNRTLAGGDRLDNVLIAQDPAKSDDRNTARTKIAWDGEAFGVFSILGQKLYFARVDRDGKILVALTSLGPAYSGTFSGQFSVVAASGVYHVGYLDKQAGKVVVLRVGKDGKALSTTPVLSGMFYYPHLLARASALYLFSHDDKTEGQVTTLTADGKIVRTEPIAKGRFMNYPVAAVDGESGKGAVAYLDMEGTVKLQRVRLSPP